MGMGMGMGFGPMPTDLGHRLLSLDGPTLYFQTNLGAVAALDAETGGDPLGWRPTPGKIAATAAPAASAT